MWGPKPDAGGGLRTPRAETPRIDVDSRLTHEFADLLVPRPHQGVARDAILAARAAGRPGFLLGDLTGLGKTLSVWSAIAAMPETDVLIVAPKGALPQWRRTMARSGLPQKSVTLINYERSKSLLALPEKSARKSTRAKNNELARRGVPRRTWPIVVFDESHRLRNPYSQQSMAAGRWRMRPSSSSISAPRPASRRTSSPTSGGCWPGGRRAAARRWRAIRELMRRLGIGGAKGRWTNWRWDAERRATASVMADALYRGPPPSGCAAGPRRSRAGPRCSATSPDRSRRRPSGGSTTRPGATSAASSACSAASPAAPSVGPPTCASARRPACSASPAPPMSPRSCSTRGQAVAVSVAYLETASMLADTLRGRGWRVGAIDGRQTRREQRGDAARLPDRGARRRDLYRDGVDLAPCQRDARRRADRARCWSTTCVTARSSSARSKAAATAMARRRWCTTSTPRTPWRSGSPARW